MRRVLGAALVALAVAGCGGGPGRADLGAHDPSGSPRCDAGWTSYPGPPECAGVASGHASDPGAAPSAAAPAARPVRTGAPMSSTPRAAATARPRRTAAASPAPAGTAGQGSAAPASPRPTTSPTASPRPTGQLVITEEDSGRTFTISLSTADALLRLGGGWLWSQPERDGSSVELHQRQFVRDPGYAEWEIRPVARGATTIRSTGSLECHTAEPPCAAPHRAFEVTVVVE